LLILDLPPEEDVDLVVRSLFADSALSAAFVPVFTELLEGNRKREAFRLASTLFMAPTADKTQRTLFMLMPLVFVFVIARFPAGLVLYWVTTNLWTVGQGLITRRLVARTPAPGPERRSSRTPPKDDGSSGNGASPEAPGPKPAPPASQRPRQVRRKKKRTSRR